MHFPLMTDCMDAFLCDNTECVENIPACWMKLVFMYVEISSPIFMVLFEISCTHSHFILTLCLQENTLIQYIPRNMHTVFALLCFVVVIHWLIFPYPSGLLHWHCGNLTIAPVPAKQPWWIWINTSCEFIMNDCITTTKQSPTKPCAYFLGYTVSLYHGKYLTYGSQENIEARVKNIKRTHRQVRSGLRVEF